MIENKNDKAQADQGIELADSEIATVAGGGLFGCLVGAAAATVTVGPEASALGCEAGSWLEDKTNER